MVKRNKRCSNEGLRDTPITNAPKTVPIPAPAPPTEIVAAPAQLILLLVRSFLTKKINKAEVVAYNKSFYLKDGCTETRTQDQ